MISPFYAENSWNQFKATWEQTGILLFLKFAVCCFYCISIYQLRRFTACLKPFWLIFEAITQSKQSKHFSKIITHCFLALKFVCIWGKDNSFHHSFHFKWVESSWRNLKKFEVFVSHGAVNVRTTKKYNRIWGASPSYFKVHLCKRIITPKNETKQKGKQDKQTCIRRVFLYPAFLAFRKHLM